MINLAPAMLIGENKGCAPFPVLIKRKGAANDHFGQRLLAAGPDTNQHAVATWVSNDADNPLDVLYGIV